MGAYVTVAQARAILSGSPVVLPSADADLEWLIGRSEVDLEAAAGAVVRDETTGRRWVATQLDVSQQLALQRAVSVQVEYRILSGEDALVRHKPSRPSGKGGRGGTAPERPARLGPRVRQELAGYGLVAPWTRADYGSSGWPKDPPL